jgi:tRNA pseudouridine38-40 synthase
MIRAAVRIAYDGSRFDAYARDPGARTVEGEFLAAAANEGAVEGTFRTGSRTDAGVSALENVVSVALERPHLKGLVPALQAHLPVGLWATAATTVPDAWNPRHARSRSYAYHHVDQGEDPARFREAWSTFQGRHDMRAFARLEEGRNPVRDILVTSLDGPHQGLWTLRVTGNGFLWNQVRRMVDAAAAVARGEATVDDIRAGLQGGSPHRAFGLAPAEGLLLERVDYGDLAWDDAAGRLGQDRIRRGLQGARVRSDLLRHLGALARLPT